MKRRFGAWWVLRSVRRALRPSRRAQRRALRRPGLADRPRPERAAQAGPAALCARRKADLLMASALLRGQAGVALDELQARSEAVEQRVQAWRDRVASWAAALGWRPRQEGAGPAPAAWARPAAAGVVALLLARRLFGRRRSHAAASAAAGPARASWAVGPLLLVALPRLWRWGRRGRRAWQILRWWRQGESVKVRRAAGR